MNRQTPLLVLTTLLLLINTSLGYEFLGSITGDNAGDQLGAAVATVDFNGDGFDDLAVGASAADDAGLSSGRVYLYFGGPSADLTPDLIFVGEASSFFGQAIASAGDFNDDGVDDLIVGGPFADQPASSAGAVFLFYGSNTPDTTVDHIFRGEAQSDYFGTSVTGLGDFNNDGFDDFAVGAYRADHGAFTDAGKTYVYYGGPSPDFVVDKILVGEADGERFGYSLAAGDFSGDSEPDIAVGAYSYDDVEVNQGRIYVFNGGTSPDSLIDTRITGDSAGGKFGWSLASGLISGDAFSDLVMGTDGYPVDSFEAGRVFVWDGGGSFGNTPSFEYTIGRLQDDFLGFSVGTGADLNADGAEDFIAGMTGNDDGGDSAGGAIVFTGGATPAVDTSILGTQIGEALGHTVTLWPHFGDRKVFVAGSIAYNSFLGRIVLYGTETAGGNQAPTLDPIADQQTAVGTPLQFTVTASDPNNDAITLTAAPVPSGASFVDNNDGTGDFSWTPDDADIGNYIVTFAASDGSLADSQDVNIVVQDSAACCVGLRGNADNDVNEIIDIGDLTYLIDFLFLSGPAPVCTEEANVDGDSQGIIDIGDLTFLIDYLFLGGAAPGSCPT